MRKNAKPFVEAKTPEAKRKQSAAIRDYYIKKRAQKRKKAHKLKNNTFCR